MRIVASQPPSLFYLPFRPALDANGIVAPGAKLFFYLTQTAIPQKIYANASLTVELENPVGANAAGVWPSIYMDPALTYRVVLKDQDGVVLNEVDPYRPGVVGEGEKGDPGSAGNVAATLEQLKAAPTTDGSYIANYDGSGSTMTWTLGDYRALNAIRPQDYVQANDVSLQTGAWVRQGADGLRYDPAQSVKRRLDLEVFTTDIRFMADGTMVGGAKLDGNGVGGGSNDGPAIQGLMNWVAEKGGGTIRVPVGTSKITSVLQVPGTVEIDGSGIFSCINNVGCDALQLMASDEIGPRKIRRVFFRGFGSDDRSGIVVDVDFPSRVMGISIENCYFAFVRYGIKSKGLWHAEITKNCFNQIYTPIYLTGRNVKVDVIGNSGTKGPSASGPGAACGVQVGDDSALRPEDVQIQRNIFVGFQRGIYWRNCLFGAATHNDLDYCTESVIHFVTADGGTDFSRNWGQVDNTSGIVRGIYGEALGIAPGVGTITITGNRMRASTVPSSPGQLLSFGADYANNQANIVSSANSYEGSFQVGLRADGVKRCVIENEKTDAQVIIFNTRDSTIGNGNYFGGGLTLSGNVGLTFGTIRGLHTTRIVTLVDIPPNQTSYTTTYLALNYPDLPLGGVTIIAQATDYGGTPHEKPISVAPTRTALNFSIPVPLGVTSTYSLTVEIMG